MRAGVLDFRIVKPAAPREFLCHMRLNCTETALVTSSESPRDTMRIPLLKAAFLVGLAVTSIPHAWGDTMRCGKRLIVNGESIDAVRAFCGRPAAVQRGFEVNATTVRVGGHALNRSHTTGSATPVETWTYNRGPHKLMVKIRFVNGTVASITTLQEYGY